MRVARVCISVLFLLVLAVAASCGQQPAISSANQKKLEASLDKYMNDTTCPGLFMVITEHGKSPVAIVKGSDDLQARRKMSTADNYRIGSITKTFTAVVLLQLVSEGKLSLDDPVSKYQPEVPNGQHITVRMLLNHTSGIFSYTEDENFVNTIKMEPLKPWTPDQLIAIGISHPPYFPPGSAFGYSNTAYVLAGKIIEQVSGNSYISEVKKRIVDKLGLKKTMMPTGVIIPERFSHGYTFDLGPKLTDITRQQTPTWGWSAGGLVSDLKDMQVCAKAFATGQLLTPAMQQEFMKPTPMPVKPGTPPGAFSGLGIGGYSGLVGNTGGTYGYASWMWYMPSKQATIIAFFNQSTQFTPEIEAKEQTALDSDEHCEVMALH